MCLATFSVDLYHGERTKRIANTYSFDALILFFEGAQSEIIKIKRTYLLLKRLFFLRNLSEFDADKVLKIN